jgi:hypothetical protein
MNHPATPPAALPSETPATPAQDAAAPTAAPARERPAAIRLRTNLRAGCPGCGWGPPLTNHAATMVRAPARAAA